MRVRFGPFVLDTGARELRRDDAPVHLSPKALQLLETLIKRRPDAVSKTLQLPGPGVSRRHLLLRVRDGEATVEDLGSKNGTYVNGRKVRAPTRLADGDEVLAGSFLMKFRLVPMAASTETEVSR